MFGGSAVSVVYYIEVAISVGPPLLPVSVITILSKEIIFYFLKFI